MKNLMQSTQLEAYNSLTELGRKQSLVYHAIIEMEQASDHDIADQLNVPINTVTPRRNELFRLGMIREARRGRSKQTGKRVIFWQATDIDEPVAEYTKKKNGRYIHTCGGQMKIRLDETDGRVTKVLVCTECGYENQN